MAFDLRDYANKTKAWGPEINHPFAMIQRCIILILHTKRRNIDETLSRPSAREKNTFLITFYGQKITSCVPLCGTYLNFGRNNNLYTRKIAYIMKTWRF